MMRKLIILALVAIGTTSIVALGSTLQRLSLNDMIVKSTMIVRGTVQPGTSSAMRGALIYTHYQVAVSSVYKGTQTPGQTVDVAIPGGVINAIHQPVAGAPMLKAGQDYVMFLWTSKSGLTQVIGLSQGLFNVSKDSQGQAVVSRGAANATVLDATGNPVADSALQMPLSQLTNTIQSVLAGSKAQ
ncbi:MAG TPA: hypothetical protein VFW44_02020 [Bryobacteraceae bacterium]|nr:hypothetical protein [Bryobacteraceae bacterium]